MTDPTDTQNPTDGRCGARKKSGGTCMHPAGHGTGHAGTGRCRRHGGASPRAEVSGQVTLARREALVMGRPLNVQPHEALLECIRIAAGEVRYASDQIARLDERDAVGPAVARHDRPLKHEGGGESRTERVEEVRHETLAPHIWIVVRQNAMDRLVNYSKVALAAGVAERQVRVAEDQGQLLAQAIRGVLTDAGIIDRPDIPGIVRRHLTLISGDPA